MPPDPPPPPPPPPPFPPPSPPPPPPPPPPTPTPLTTVNQIESDPIASPTSIMSSQRNPGNLSGTIFQPTTAAVSRSTNSSFITKSSNSTRASTPSLPANTSLITDLPSTTDADTQSATSSSVPITGSADIGAHDLAHDRVMRIALAVPIVLVCVGVLALCIRRKIRKIQNRFLSRIREGSVADLDAWKREPQAASDNRTVVPFELSPSFLTTTSPFTDSHEDVTSAYYSESTLGIGLRPLRRNQFASTPTTHRESTLKPSAATLFPPAIPETELENQMEAEASLVGERAMPTGQNAASEDNGQFITREEVENLRERLRLVENIALSLTDHDPDPENVRNLERELRELIPPPEYAGTPRTISHNELMLRFSMVDSQE